jgi:outer membrane protein
LEVQQAVSDLETSKAKLKSTQLQVEQAAEAVKRAEVSYINGVITNLDLLDAETSLSEAKLLHLKVIFQNVVNAYNLKEAIGDVIR